LLHNPPIGYRVEPIYATVESHGYRYAREFTLAFLGCPVASLTDDLIEARSGDIFVGLDLQPHVVPAQLEFLESLRSWGVRVYFVVYDLLPILIPYAFSEGGDISHINWLNAIVRFDGALCISYAVAGDLTKWLESNAPKRLRPFKIGWFHLGADIENSMPTSSIPDHASQVLAQLASHPSFLMLGTIEPRKCHTQTLAAFEQLWAEGVDANLVIVGKHGWKMETLIETLRCHPELGKRLFWLEGISDEYLEKVYAASSSLIAASEGEGFGLPLIEAAQHKLPIIARDIPVFHEVAGKHAYYFSGLEPDDLARAVREWQELYQSGLHQKSDDMPWLTWKQSTQHLLDVILQENWYTEWMPQKTGQ
jgi:glycosyltransferase involved in cell wall biosynthesis